jgi:hypothetical protein
MANRATCSHVCFFPGLFLCPEDGEQDVPPKLQLIFNHLQSVISQEIEIFIGIVIRNSNHIWSKLLLLLLLLSLIIAYA